MVLIVFGVTLSGHHLSRKRSGLKRYKTLARNIVARSFSPTVLVLFGGIFGIQRLGSPLERMKRALAFEEGVGVIFSDLGLVELVVSLAVPDSGAGNEGSVSTFDGWLGIVVRVQEGAGGKKSSATLTVLIQSDLLGIADEETAVGISLTVVLVGPLQDGDPQNSRAISSPTIHLSSTPE